MKFKKLLSGVLAAAMALSSVAVSSFTTLAADEPSDIVLPDSGAWKRTSITNSAKLEFVPNGTTQISALSGKSAFYVTFTVTGVPESGVRAYLPTVVIGGTAHWSSDDVVPFTAIPEDGTYTVKFDGETIPDPAKLQYCGINCKSLTSNSDAKVSSIELVKVTLTDPNALTVIESFDVSEKQDGSVTATIYSDNSMVVSGTGATKDYLTSYDSYKTEITSLTVEEGVTTLGADMFKEMTNLQSVSFPNTLTSIGANCFEGCTNLASDIVIPSSVTSIEKNAFEKCTSIKSVKILGSLSYMGSSIFSECSALESVEIAEGLKEINMRSFRKCSSLKSVKLPDSVTSIGDYCFYQCGSLTSITLPKSLTAINEYAFMEASIESLTLPDGIESIGNMAFSGCKKLTGTLVLPESLTDVGKFAFNKTNVESVTIKMKSGDLIDTFSSCASLKSVSFPDSVTNMSLNSTFWQCTALESITIPNGVTTIGDSTFFECTSLKSVTIPDSVTSIGKDAFIGDEALETCEISSSSKIASIGEFAFNSCTSLKSITIPAGVTIIDRYTFRNCLALESVTFAGNSLETIGDYAFRECKALTSIDIPEGVKTIGKQAFYSCENLNSVKLPSTLTTIGNNAFMNNIRLSTIAIPDSVTSLGTGAFNCCGLQGDIVIPASITKLPSNVFKYCAYPNLNIYVMGEITEVSEDSFAECTGKIYVNDRNSYNLIEATDHGTAKVIYLGETDKTELDAIIAEAEAINTDDYTLDSVKALSEAVEEGKTVKENIDATEEVVQKAVQAIRDAINALVAGDTDAIKAELESLVNKVEKLLTVKDESSYTAESWTALNEALKAAQEALASEEELTYSGYKAVYENLNSAYTGLTVVSTSNSDYVGTIYGGYEVTYNHETDSYKVVVSDDVDMDKVVGTTYVKVTFTPNKDLSTQIPYGTLHIWNFLDNDKSYSDLKGNSDNVMTYSLSIPSSTSAFSLTAGTGWTKSDEVFYVKNVEFYNENDELLYTYDASSVGTGDMRNLKSAIEKAEEIDNSVCTEESAAVLELALEEAKAILNNSSATKDDYNVYASELETAIAAIEYLPADYTKVNEAKAKVPADLSGYTDETVSALNEALNAVVEGKNITEQETVDAYAKAIEDAIAGLELKPVGVTVTGTIKVSDKDDSTEMTVKAVAADGTETAVTATSIGEYVIENLAVGDYTLEISGGKYATRTYEITVAEGGIAQDVELNPWGDINGDGDVTTADVGMANSHAKGVKTLEGYQFVCANVSDKAGAEVTTADVGMINSHAKGVKALW